MALSILRGLAFLDFATYYPAQIIGRFGVNCGQAEPRGLCMTKKRIAGHRTTTGLIIIAMLGLIPAVVHAGPCSDDIAQFKETVRDSAGNPLAGLMAPQSVDAQLDHQPTPSSVQRAKDRLHAKFHARMALAERLDKQGDRAGCMRALSAAKRMYIP